MVPSQLNSRVYGIDSRNVVLGRRRCPKVNTRLILDAGVIRDAVDAVSGHVNVVVLYDVICVNVYVYINML